MLTDDFREFLELLNAHDVEFMVVGGHAVSFHGFPRFTHDIDVVVKPDIDNAKRVHAALVKFGFGALQISVSELTQPVTVVLGRPPEEVDIMTFVKGVDLERAWERRVTGLLEGVCVMFISLEDLLANKRAVGRPQDLADVARLEEP